MNSTAALRRQPDALARLNSLLPQFTARAERYDATDEFVAENYAVLQRLRLMSAAVPRELGGDGLDAAGLAPLLVAMAKSCASTALAFAMHTHAVALTAWRWRQHQAPVDALLRRVADEQIVLITSGGSDWLDSSGTARRTEGGFLVDAIKAFASGVPAGSLLSTSAVFDDPEAGPTVLHFLVPLSDPNVIVEPTWRAMGMRGTGSHRVRLDGVFIPDAAISVRRPRGRWHPLYHLVAMIAVPIIYSVYYGVGEALRDASVGAARSRRTTPALVELVGSLETELAAARYAHAEMLAASAAQPGPETTNRIFLARANLVRSLLAAAERGFDVAQGSGYMRTGPIERLFRDIQAARFHPLPAQAQQAIAGRLALGLDLDQPIA